MTLTSAIRLPTAWGIAVAAMISLATPHVMAQDQTQGAAEASGAVSDGEQPSDLDEVDGIHRIDHDEFKPPPPTVELGDSRFTESIFILAERQVGLLEGDLVRHAFALAVGGMR